MTERLTPNELRNQVFRTKMRGYDRQEVLAVLEEVADQWENLIAQDLRLEEKNAILEAQLKKYADLEQTLRDTLIVARKAAEEDADAAKKQAQLVVEQARLKAEEIVREADARSEEYRREVRDLQTTRSRLQAELRALLHSFAEQLDRFEGRTKGETTGAVSRESAAPSRERPSGPAPSRTFTIPPRRERQPAADDSAADFDASLSKIFGDDAEASPADPLFSEGGTFDEPAPASGKPQEQQPDKPAPGVDDEEKNW